MVEFCEGRLLAHELRSASGGGEEEVHAEAIKGGNGAGMAWNRKIAHRTVTDSSVFAWGHKERRVASWGSG